MFGDGKNIKDSSTNLDISIKDSFLPLSYTKINKLITAVYIVTDIMEKDEPIRLKLRTLGTEIISDINLASRETLAEKIQAILSFLDIGAAINIISPMNAGILRKEFLELGQSLKESKQVNPEWLTNFLPSGEQALDDKLTSSYIDQEKIKPITQRTPQIHKGHNIGQIKDATFRRTTLGVRDPNALMQMLSDKSLTQSMETNFNVIKDNRRQGIIKILKDSRESLTITDIKSRASGVLKDFSEKTLQRELAAMVKDGLLYKSGEKRWSRYSIRLGQG